jgi:hypothetical protein
VKYLIKSIGTADEPIPDFWVTTATDLKRLAFPRHRKPDIEAGDRVVVYATWHQHLIAAGVFTGDAELDPDVLVSEHGWDEEDARRWPWVATWEPQVLVPFVHLGPHLTDIGVSTLSIRSQSHIYIDEAKYRRAVGLLATAAASNGEIYVPAFRDAVSLG